MQKEPFLNLSLSQKRSKIIFSVFHIQTIELKNKIMLKHYLQDCVFTYKMQKEYNIKNKTN